MRLRHGVVCATATCAGATAALASVASCVSDNNGPLPGLDASSPEVLTSQPDTGVVASETGGPDSTPPPIDAAGDTAPVLDAATFDAGDTGSCAPASIAGFTVPAYVHANPQPGIVCADSYDQEMAQLCLDASAFTACATYATTGAEGGVPPTCGACLVTPETLGPDAGAEAGYGPSIIGVAATPNVGGCIELADPSDGGLACAMAVQAAWRCAEFSCTASCPVSDDATRAAYTACLQSAATGPCVAFTQAATVCLAAEADAGGIANQWCFPPPEAGAVEQFTDIARFFCSS